MIHRRPLTEATMQGFSHYNEELFTGEPCTLALSVSLPKDAHTALLEAGQIPDPRNFDHVTAVSWVEEKTWVYTLPLHLAPLNGERYELFCEGLDTYCTLFVNNTRVCATSNMLIPHLIDITAFVREGENTLRFVFAVMKEKAQKSLPEGFWINSSAERAYCRKAAFQYGWDWCPRLCTVGIWRPITLRVSDAPYVRHCFLAPLDVSEEAATLRCTAELSAPSMPGDELCFTLEGNGQRFEARMSADADDCLLLLTSPRLWWCHDLGEPFLYKASVALCRSGRVLDQQEFTYGVRSIEVCQQDEDTGENRFFFRLNGVPVYSKGANWVPVDALLTLPNRNERIQTLISLAKGADMNMLNLWGGGIYEDDLLYELCDREGILLWQYLMFACGEAPDFDSEFVEAVLTEVTCAVRRLRNHCSIALWTGNVEAEMLSQKIGLKRPMHGVRLFEQLLPSHMAALDPSRLYWPSSPFGGALCNSETEGDRHNWDIWFQKIPYTDYRKDHCLFSSEFGVHAPPNLCTLRRYLPEAELHPQSYGYNLLNYDSDPSRMSALLEFHTGIPTSLDRLVDVGMLMQADALRTAVEHYRLHMPKNGGALIWQLGDCVPCHSWSMIDYDLVPKASYYAAKSFFAPVSVILNPLNDDETEVYLSNTTREPFAGEIDLSVQSFLGDIIWQERIAACATPHSVSLIYTLRVGGRFYPNVTLPSQKRFFFVAASMAGFGQTFRFFAEFKDLRLPSCTLQVSAEQRDGQLSLTVQTDRFAKLVHLEGDLCGLSISEHYFDLCAGDKRTLKLTRAWGAPLSWRGLRVEALNGRSIWEG